ncbi:MAG TPA: DUF1684 domain-containing protein [Polyangia bacterium]|jgi:uncharacterized protein (DUF1684 family)|nr:DUF1684 domain-containing protein [Polyangia bacterium]
MSGRPFEHDRAEHEAAVQAWRSARLGRLTTPDGWLSLVGRFPLDEGASRAGGSDGCEIPLPADKAPPAVGVFQRTGAEVTFTPAAAVAIALGGRDGTHPLTPGVAVRVRSDRGGPPDKLALGALTLELTERESGIFVRVRDPDSPARRGFTGIDHYPIDPKWRVVARFEPYAEPKLIELDYEAGTTQRYVSPGAAVFEIDGAPCRLEPVYEDEQRKRLYLVFWDPTARDTTYGAGRFLYAPLPEGDRVLLDFNLAFSPPCAFTPYSACPVAPPQNRLHVRVEAGERSAHCSGETQ